MQDCYKKLYDGGMKGRVQYAYSKFEFSHEKYWIIDSTTVHLSTGIYNYSYSVHNAYHYFTLHSTNTISIVYCKPLVKSTR
jgi:hypothetical protein